jgi:GntR family transcriptional regulator
MNFPKSVRQPAGAPMLQTNAHVSGEFVTRVDIPHTGGKPAEWRPDFASIRGRVYLSIASQIEQAIRSEIFRVGDKLPSQRAIADDLGFSVNTINAAFKEAARRGLVQGCTRRGTVVVRVASEVKESLSDANAADVTA